MSLARDWLWPRTGEDPMVYLDDVFKYALARTGNREDSEDVAIEVVQALPNPCRRRDLRLYMIGMARRKIAGKFRRTRITHEPRDPDQPASFDDRSNEIAQVAMVMAGLSDEHREVLGMRFMLGLSSKEVARITGRRSEAVDSLVQRAKAAFAAEWNRLESDEVMR